MSTPIASRRAFRFHPLVWAGAAALLLAPAAAMLVTGEVDWGPEDFIVFGLMLTVLCLCVEAACHWLDTPLRRYAAIGFACLGFLAVWAELAVGLFD